jgi:hypothetical protein
MQGFVFANILVAQNAAEFFFAGVLYKPSRPYRQPKRIALP